ELVVVDETEAGLAVERYGPEPEALSAKMVRGLPRRSVSERGAVGPGTNLLRREVSQLLDIDQSVDPEEVRPVANLALAREPQPAGKEPSAPRRIHDPARGSGHFTPGRLERERVWPAGFRQRHIKIEASRMK